MHDASLLAVVQRELLVHFARVDVMAVRQDSCASVFIGVRVLLVACR